MTPIRITTKLESDTLTLPELRPLVGKTVEIRVVEAGESAIDRDEDHEFYAELEAEFANDPTPVPTIEEVRAMLTHDTSNWAAEIIADREERF